MTADRYLNVDQVAKLLGTSVRFPRRLIAERRITFVKVGRHVRIPESELTAYIEAHTVRPASRGIQRSSRRKAVV